MKRENGAGAPEELTDLLGVRGNPLWNSTPFPDDRQNTLLIMEKGRIDKNLLVEGTHII